MSYSFYNTFRNPNGSTIWKKTPVLILLLLLPIAESTAQSGGFSGAFTRMGFGPRGMAMGNAMGTVTQEGIYAHYNPALAGGITGKQIDFSTAMMSFDRSLHAVNATFSLPPSAGLNVGLLNANVHNIDGRTSSGYHTDNLSTHEFQLFAAFGINISSRISLGASAKLHMANFYDNISNANGAGFDIGMMAKPTDTWRIGFAIQDLLSEYNWNTTDLYGAQGGRNRSDPIPTRFRLSTSYFFTEWDLLVSSEFEIQQLHSEYQQRQVPRSVPPQNTSSTESITSNSQLFRIGAAWSAHERITLRGGWEVMDLDFMEETSKLSTGFSVHLPYDALRPSVDYAFIREPLGVAGIHVLSLRLYL